MTEFQSLHALSFVALAYATWQSVEDKKAKKEPDGLLYNIALFAFYAMTALSYM
jgi:hypothetical protein